ncbi:hypothetical protein SAMN06296036_105268 [Pseudobacteriovorax antillogorgiicola]|uniref:Uncharacterized protein n=2 Tax=Pseudobacteriovorax antillogorgiicola TaxID=1513793 RepID=A0A1Y6BJ30_9BACT|nr:hypothetical protein EDD56_10556 [Pseudobacteriovorax antillogorgiicola]SMF14030.1 hypothetical protein SAMN06296036_105268 [Pseudobacteriovorax antillogorgiicola]
MVRLENSRWNLFELSENQLTEKYVGSVTNLSLNEDKAAFSFLDDESRTHRFNRQTKIRLKGKVENLIGDKLTITLELTGSFHSTLVKGEADFFIEDSKVRYQSSTGRDRLNLGLDGFSSPAS